MICERGTKSWHYPDLNNAIKTSPMSRNEFEFDYNLGLRKVLKLNPLGGRNNQFGRCYNNVVIR